MPLWISCRVHGQAALPAHASFLVGWFPTHIFLPCFPLVLYCPWTVSLFGFHGSDICHSHVALSKFCHSGNDVQILIECRCSPTQSLLRRCRDISHWNISMWLLDDHWAIVWDYNGELLFNLCSAFHMLNCTCRPNPAHCMTKNKLHNDSHLVLR